MPAVATTSFCDVGGSRPLSSRCFVSREAHSFSPSAPPLSACSQVISPPAPHHSAGLPMGPPHVGGQHNWNKSLVHHSQRNLCNQPPGASQGPAEQSRQYFPGPAPLAQQGLQHPFGVPTADPEQITLLEDNGPKPCSDECCTNNFASVPLDPRTLGSICRHDSQLRCRSYRQ